MARVNITIPDELHRRGKRAGLNFSQLTQAAIAAELNRLSKIAELDAYLAELDTELGPLTAEERAAADAWADKVLAKTPGQRSA